MKTQSRRTFLKNSGITLAGMGLSALYMPSVFAQGAPNKKIVVAVVGVNSRGNYLAKLFAAQPDTEVAYICDVDLRAMNKTINDVAKIQKRKPKAEKDFRKALEDKGVDAVVIAMPDHWHAPAAILACSMGKHVYVEKPISHNPREGELLIEAAKKYNRLVQVGSQRRSGTNIQAMIRDLRSGIIGKPYMAKCWYANGRGPTFLSPGPVPDWLDYDLWQGPAPRMPYQNNLIHYNWHWFWHWGTGEALNNGTHEVDVARWGLNVDFPERVTSAGGRYCFNDDWETPDTQTLSAEFPDKKMITWEGKSCNKYKTEGSDRGVIFYGEKGTVYYPGANSYTIYDSEGKIIKSEKDNTDSKETNNTVSAGGNLDEMHVCNFLDSLRGDAVITASPDDLFKSTLIVQLGNIAWRTGDTLNIDSRTGHILNNAKAEALWSRSYEPGWEPRV
ncbi:MAG: Gfo/Idh/MocA family oxidoreductase [Bacteroidales bacterium]|nr:Gfo/Idh/MocA family oxidoreductase [Bacteroidales bacterium]